MDYSFKPTTHGRAVIAACMSLGKPPDICRVAFGSGRIAEGVNLADQHDLLHYVADGTIGSRRHEDDHFYFTIQYANNKHPEVPTFYLSEFIVYIRDPETRQEVDLLYGTLGDYILPVPKYHDTIPPGIFDLPLVLVIADDVTVQVSSPPGLVTHGELADLINATAIRRADIIIPATGWVGGGGGRYQYYRDVPVRGATQRLIPSLTILPEGIETAWVCGIAPFVQTLDGAVRVFASSVPVVSIPASLTLQGDASSYCRVGTGDGAYSLPPATASTIGAVKPGDGLSVSEDGTMSVDKDKILTGEDLVDESEVANSVANILK